MLSRYFFIFFAWIFFAQLTWAGSHDDTKDVVSETLYHLLCHLVDYPRDKKGLSSLADAVSRYERAPGGVVAPNRWLLYLWSKEIVTQKLQPTALARDQIDSSFQIGLPPEGMMRIAQEFVHALALEPSGATKVATTIARDGEGTLFKFAMDSFTLYVPLSRAYEKFKAEQGPYLDGLVRIQELSKSIEDNYASLLGRAYEVFRKNHHKTLIEYISDEFKEGYWHDQEFCDVLRYFNDYFRYELYLAKEDPHSLNYDLLTSDDIRILNSRQIANFLFLRFINPALTTILPRFEKDEIGARIKVLTQQLSLKIFYQSHERQKNLASIDSRAVEGMHDITEIILTSPSPKKERATKRDKTSKRTTKTSREKPVAKKVLSGSFAQLGFSDPSTIKYAIECHQNSMKKSKAVDRDNIIKEIISSLEQLPASSLFLVYASFVSLQKNIRHVLEYKLLPNDLMRFVNGTWETKVMTLLVLDRLAKSHKEIKRHVIRFANYLAHSAHFLQIPELNKLLYVLALPERKLMTEFQYVNSVLDYVLLSTFKRRTRAMPTASSSNSNVETSIDGNVLSPLMAEQIHLCKSNLSSRPPKKELDPVDLKFNMPSVGGEKRKVVSVVMPLSAGLGAIMEKLSDTSIFNGVDYKVLHLVARMARVKNLSRGSTLYTQGEISRSVAIISDGTLEIINSEAPSEQLLATLKPGQVVGEMSIFKDDARRTATVRAGEAGATVIEIGKEPFIDLTNNNFVVLNAIFTQLVAKASASYKKIGEAGLMPSDLTIFRSLLDCQKGDLLRLCTIKKCARGEELLYEGQAMQNLFLTRTLGFAQSRYSWPKDELPIDSWLSELSFLRDDGMSSWTVIAEDEDCSCFCLSRQNFSTAVADNPAILWNMMKTIVEIIAENNTKLRDTNNYRLQYACESDDVGAVHDLATNRDLLDLPCLVLSDMNGGTRPIHVTARYGSLSALNFLVVNGATIDSVDEAGNTAAHIAAKFGNVEFLQALHQHKANFKIENHDGKRAYKVALDLNHEDAITFFREKNLEDSDSALSYETENED